MKVSNQYDAKTDVDNMLRNYQGHCQGQVYNLKKKLQAVQAKPSYGQKQFEAVNIAEAKKIQDEIDVWSARAAAAGKGMLLCDHDVEWGLRHQELRAACINAGRVQYLDDITKQDGADKTGVVTSRAT